MTRSDDLVKRLERRVAEKEAASLLAARLDERRKVIAEIVGWLNDGDADETEEVLGPLSAADAIQAKWGTP